MKIRLLRSMLFICVCLGTACGQSAETAVPATATDAIEIMATDTAVPTNLPPNPEILEPETYTAQVNSYNLGETIILQDHFPEDSRFRNMPVRLEGVIGVPESDEAHPVVLIMHGSHNVCGGEDIWPCPENVEQRNYEGFTYLVEALAEAGYVALSINVNAEHTFAFGEAPPSVRTTQLIDLHLGELVAANAAKSDKFGVDLNGRIDPSRMVWLGHSRGADFTNWIIREQNLVTTASPIGYGPVAGMILLAPPLVALDTLPTADLPFSVILPACDSDVSTLSGQRFYESARFDPERTDWGSSVYVEGANHNYFNAILDAERLNYPADRPDCTAETSLTAEQQQEFLTQYTLDFLQTLFAQPEMAFAAKHRLGMVTHVPMPTTFHQYAVRFNFMPSTAKQRMIMQPQSEAERSQNLLGGESILQNVTALFCPDGYYVPATAPGTELCKRVNFNQPGYPQEFVVSWESADAEWRMVLPEAQRDLSAYTAVQLRVALDPLSELNTLETAQRFTLALVDTSGESAQVIVPEIPYPLGVIQENEYFDGGMFTGHVFLTDLRIPITEFAQVDLNQINEIVFRFDQTKSGTLFIADVHLLSD